LDGGGVKAPKGVRVAVVSNQGSKARGEEAVCRRCVSWGDNCIEIADQSWSNGGGGDQGGDGGEQNLSVPVTSARGGMEVKKGESATCDDMGDAGAVFHRRRARDARESGDRSAAKRRGEELVASRGCQTGQRGRRGQFLKKNQVWAVLTK
jgi:hypothetical protein